MVGVLTFHKSLNYGSVLQAYALSTYLKGQGIENEIIDYEPKEYQKLYSLYETGNSARTQVKNILLRLLVKSTYKSREESFNRFRSAFLPLSAEKYYCDSDFEDLNKKYSAIICGSDQIWNVNILDCDDIYFLPMNFDGKRISYAVSINKADYLTNPRCNEELKGWIRRFDGISLREESGCNQIRRFIEDFKVVRNDVDPTFLLHSYEYKKLIKKIDSGKEYIFLFSVTFSNEAVSFAKKLSAETELPVFSLITGKSSYRYVANPKEKIRFIKNKQGIEDFLSLAANARYIVTDSFHGTAFSLIFNKEFFTVNRRDPQGNAYNDERQMSLLRKLDLLDRFIQLPDFDLYSTVKEIDYQLINEKVDLMARESKEYLSAMLEGIK